LLVGLELVICTTEFSVLLKISGNVKASEADIDDDNELGLTSLLELLFDSWAIACGEAIPKNREVARMANTKIQI
jgi:hypothetical protein